MRATAKAFGAGLMVFCAVHSINMDMRREVGGSGFWIRFGYDIGLIVVAALILSNAMKQEDRE